MRRKLGVMGAALAALGLVVLVAYLSWFRPAAHNTVIQSTVRVASLGADVLILAAPAGLVRRGPRRVVVVRMQGPAELVPYHFESAGIAEPAAVESWAEHLGSPLVFNAGQFDENQRHLGWLKSGGQWLSPHRKSAWMGLLASGPPHGTSLPWAWIVDLEDADPALITERYRNLVQSMMLVDHRRHARVRRSDLAACRTVVAEDKQGRVLVIVTEGAMTLYDLARWLPETELDIVRAMNLDGGVESQLFIRAPELQLVIYGQFGTGQSVLEGNTGQIIRYPLPAVIAWRPVAAAPTPPTESFEPAEPSAPGVPATPNGR